MSQPWFYFRDRLDHNFRDETIRSCHLGKLFQFVEGRNVWGPIRDPWLGGREPNLKNTYPALESFSEEIDIAKMRVGSRRTQGSKWVIWELPVVVVSAAEQSLLIGEINTNEFLSGYPPVGAGSVVSLGQFAEHFTPRVQDSVFRIVCPAGTVAPSILPLYRHRSSSYGGDYRLEWSEDRDVQAEIEVVLRVIHDTNKHLQQVPRSIAA